jgi:YHS domain-containing protein
MSPLPRLPAGLLLALLACAGRLPAADTPPAPAPACPVSGHAIDKTISLDYKGGKLYFCSRQCLAAFQAGKDKYAARANYQLALTGQAQQVACPFTGRALNPNIPAETVGQLSVGFCCRGCKNTVARTDPKDRIELVFGDPFDKAYVVKKE